MTRPSQFFFPPEVFGDDSDSDSGSGSDGTEVSEPVEERCLYSCGPIWGELTNQSTSEFLSQVSVDF